jgi:superfamily II DNA or RNA helicase
MARPSFALLSTRLRPFETYFAARTRMRGLHYAQSGRVELGDANHAWLSAVVEGSEPYDVELELRGATIAASCTCPYFVDNAELCKHVWATMVVGDAEGALPWLADARNVVVASPSEGGAGVTATRHTPVEVEAPAPRARPHLRLVQPARPIRAPAPWRPPAVSWRDVVQRTMASPSPAPSPGRADLRFVVDTEQTRTRDRLFVRLFKRGGRKAGAEWRETRAPRPISTFAPPSETPIVAMLDAWASPSASYSYYAPGRSPSGYEVPVELAPPLVERMAASGRLRLDDAEGEIVAWDAQAYRVAIEVAPVKGRFEIRTALERGEERVAAEDLVLILASGLAFWKDRVAPVEGAALPWVIQQRLGGPVRLPAREVDDFVEALHARPVRPVLRLPPEMALRETSVDGRAYIFFQRARRGDYAGEIVAEAGLDYEGVRVPLHAPGSAVVDREGRRLVMRSAAREDEARTQLANAGVRPARLPVFDDESQRSRIAYRVAERRLDAAAKELADAGWRVEVDGSLRRGPGSFAIDVTSGIDWLDVRVRATFDGVEASLPELLAAARQKRRTVVLCDGSVGHLPEAWIDRLRRWAALSPAGAAELDALRFTRTQASLVAALVDQEEHATVDAAFAKLRASLDSFAGVQPLEAPKSFRGELRDYQKFAVGWFAALRDLGLGGCLADDMGLGKTVQVLAMLEQRRQQKPASGPSLVVAPRSVIPNWVEEARRFAPGVRVLVHAGADRLPPGAHFRRFDLVLVTYGILRKDAAGLARVAFDYVILDEAQAIKTARTEAAKAARLLEGRHRLALTGTPVENHAGELGSLLDFLNPGILGAGGLAALGTSNRNLDPAMLAVVARAVRPFLLRRTKHEVARELPERVEQTIPCELQGDERRRYDELHAHYRASLAARVQRDGVARSTVHILEALLRLRQAACHPGLLDDARRVDSSAKLDVLLDRLLALRDQGQKALVFSQFTSLLAIVRERLDERGIGYAYLDGKTQDRAACVARFQTDPACGVFLISLKAGGVGLNLTAAEYVFLLDPWWNPAVEAQAIDRAHRIGQLRTVIAYRLIARGTVEEKVAELQEQKRAVADALLGASESSSSLGGLTREDLEHLLA